MNENTSNTHEKAASSKKLRFALIRCVTALLLAGILLAATSFGVIGLLQGPVVTTAIQNEEEGAFVYCDINAILGFYADEATSGGKVTARYGIIAMGGKLISVRFTERYLESAGTLYTDTVDLINGNISELQNYIVVQGTVKTLSEENSALLYDWFGLNIDQLVAIGAVTDTEDYANSLSDNYLLVDTVEGINQNVVIAVSVIVGLLLLYMLVELVLMGTGFYLPKPESAAKDDASEAPESEGGADTPPVEGDGNDA